MASLSRILLYPLKSGDGIEVPRATLLPGGALLHDRRWAMMDVAGRFVNGKRFPAVHRLRTTVDPVARTIGLRIPGEVEQVFRLHEDRESLEAELSGYFGQPVRLGENSASGFPDDVEAPGPTIVSTATLETVASWFPGLTVDAVRLRFRANLEIGDVEPFWEDRLYGPPDEPRLLRIGDVELLATNPCQRCAVPPRDPMTGEDWPDFATRFRAFRKETLPAWAEPSQFNHFYRLAVNTRPSSSVGGVLHVGDAIVPLDHGESYR